MTAPRIKLAEVAAAIELKPSAKGRAARARVSAPGRAERDAVHRRTSFRTSGGRATELRPNVVARPPVQAEAQMPNKKAMVQQSRKTLCLHIIQYSSALVWL
jgi:hypothetical protein